MLNDYDSYGYRPEPEEKKSGVVGRARIKVMGIGGAGNNAVNRMLDAGITSAEYYVVNTDSQVLALSPCENKIQIGAKLTKGLGAGADPDVGRDAAEESKEELTEAIKDTDLLFITAGMGGGTGTGAAPIVARIAREMKILTVAVVTEPFDFEGRKRYENTVKGIDNLKKYVDTLVIIPNDKIKTVVAKNTPVTEAFRVADEILKQGIKGITELIVNPSLINLDFADVRTILKDKGIAHLGVGVAKGDNRIIEAVRVAVNCPLLETTIEGARGVILNVCGGPDLTFDEVSDAAALVKSVVDASANIIFGARIDPNVHDEVEITVIATGFNGFDNKAAANQRNAGYRSGVSYGAGEPYRNEPNQGRMSVAEPPYPTRPVQPQSSAQFNRPYNDGQAYPQPGYAPQQNDFRQDRPVNSAQYTDPQVSQNQPVREEPADKQPERKIPKFIQILKNGKKNDE